MKYIVIFLLLANVSYFFWSRSEYSDPVVMQTREALPLLNNGMTLVTEYELQRQELEVEIAENNKTCLLISNINSLDDAVSLKELASESELEAAIVLLGERLPSQYRVFIPPASSRPVATLILDSLSERLSEASLDIETYLITRGTLLNGIALGVYPTSDEANEILNTITSLDFSPEIEEIPLSEDGIALRLESSVSLGLDSSQWLDLASQSPALEATENLCETIAQGEQFP